MVAKAVLVKMPSSEPEIGASFATSISPMAINRNHFQMFGAWGPFRGED